MKFKPENFTNDKWKGLITILCGVLIAGVVIGIFPHTTDSEISSPGNTALTNIQGNEKTPVSEPANETTSDSILEDNTSDDIEYETPDPLRITDIYTCTRVIDGDTIECEDVNTMITVRMIGIDTPESVAPEESGKINTEEGKTASDYTKNLLEGKMVFLEFDKEQTDEYGRTLAYVYLDAFGEDFVNEMLLEDGMAECMEIEPNTRYAALFENAEAQAKQNGAGFWGTGFFE